MKLLTMGSSNHKLALSIAGRPWIDSYIMSFAPADLSGFQVCQAAKAAHCLDGCLHFTGHQFANIGKARVVKTRLLFEHRDVFAYHLERELQTAVKRADGRCVAVRLNGYSDLPWERMPILGGHTVFARFGDIQFWDYTKIRARVQAAGLAKLPANYHLTYSYASEREGDMDFALDCLARGVNVSVILDIPKSRPVPDSLWGYPAIDGDESDYRWFDPKGVVVILRRKLVTAKRKGGKDGQ